MNATEKFINCLVGPTQTLEDVLNQVLFGRMLDNAVGAQLTMIGKIVGRPRNGISDDDLYRRVVRAQISTNKSNGTIEDLITIADLVVHDDDARYVVYNYGRAALVLEVVGVVTDSSIAQLLVSMLRQGKAGGVRLQLVHHLTDAALEFAFDGGTDGAGWGSALDPTVGGPMADALE